MQMILHCGPQFLIKCINSEKETFWYACYPLYMGKNNWYICIYAKKNNLILSIILWSPLQWHILVKKIPFLENGSSIHIYSKICHIQEYPASITYIHISLYMHFCYLKMFVGRGINIDFFHCSTAHFPVICSMNFL